VIVKATWVDAAGTAPRPEQQGAQEPIPLDRLKRLVENTYPEVSRLGSADSAVWILIDMFDGRVTYRSLRAPLASPMTNASVARLVGTSQDSLISFVHTRYPISALASAPTVDVVVARLRPGSLPRSSWQTYVAPTIDQDSVRQNFLRIREILTREIPLRFPEVRTASDTRLLFVLSHDFRILRAERVDPPGVPGNQWTRTEPGADWTGGFGFGPGRFGPGSVALSFSVMPGR
jgi:hypothetical protein